MKPVIETIGNCKTCGQYGDLGDGLCLRCFDLDADSPKYLVNQRSQTKQGERIRKMLKAGKSVREIARVIKKSYRQTLRLVNKEK